MVIHNVTNKVDFDAALKEHDVVVVDAYAEWCGPCKFIAPVLAKFSEEFTTAYFVKVDVDDVPDVAQELGIRAMPTFKVFKKGEQVAVVVGADPNKLRAAIVKATATA